MHPLSRNICASQHILSILALEKMVVLSLPKAHSVYALQLRFPELPKMDAMVSALRKIGKKCIFNKSIQNQSILSNYF